MRSRSSMQVVDVDIVDGGLILALESGKSHFLSTSLLSEAIGRSEALPEFGCASGPLTGILAGYGRRSTGAELTPAPIPKPAAFSLEYSPRISGLVLEARPK
jgi:hypothetical protein